MKHMMFVAALLVVGCGKKSADSGGPSCADAVDKAVSAMPGGPGGGDEVKAKLKPAMTTRCTDDKWSAEVRTCYATKVTDMASMKACREKLTPEQQDKVRNDIRNVMMGSMGAGGGPMHGGMGGPGMGGPGMGGTPPAGGDTTTPPAPPPPPPAGSAAP